MLIMFTPTDVALVALLGQMQRSKFQYMKVVGNSCRKKYVRFADVFYALESYASSETPFGKKKLHQSISSSKDEKVRSQLIKDVLLKAFNTKCQHQHLYN